MSYPTHDDDLYPHARYRQVWCPVCADWLANQAMGGPGNERGDTADVTSEVSHTAANVDVVSEEERTVSEKDARPSEAEMQRRMRGMREAIESDPTLGGLFDSAIRSYRAANGLGGIVHVRFDAAGPVEWRLDGGDDWHTREIAQVTRAIRSGEYRPVRPVDTVDYGPGEEPEGPDYGPETEGYIGIDANGHPLYTEGDPDYPGSLPIRAQRLAEQAQAELDEETYTHPVEVYVSTVLDRIEEEARFTKPAHMTTAEAIRILIDERHERLLLNDEERQIALRQAGERGLV